MCIPGCHLFSFYTGELNFGQTIGDITPGAIGNIFGNAFGNTLGTWEPVENMMKTFGCMKFLFPKLFVTIFCIGLWQGQNFGDIVGTHLNIF
jgi:hypothetical protein